MRVAIIGSGCSGLGATWLLNEYSDNEVHLFEAENRPGGHANTVPFSVSWCPILNTDAVPKIVLNPSTYPNFLSFLKQEGIPIVPTEMTFSVSRNSGSFEWAGKNLFTVFCQLQNLFEPSMWRLVWDVLRFNASVRKLLHSKTEDPHLSIGTYLQREGYSDSFRDNYLIASRLHTLRSSPMTAAIWSTPPDTCATDFPARTLIQFMNNHHLLQLTGKPSWLTIKGGSRVYVNRIISRLPKSQLHLSTPVLAVKTTTEPRPSVLITTEGGETSTYDHVIMACHSDMSLKLLERGGYVTSAEREVLSGVSWSKNEAVLHSDTELMPRRRIAWSCWNYLTSSANQDGKVKANVNQVALTYFMNDLQHISEDDHGPVLVTLNPPFDPRPEAVSGRYTYEHPVLNAKAWSSQRALSTIQNIRGISYAGAWTAFGFHEDGFTSGLVAATTSPLSVHPPFDIRYPNRDPGPLWPTYIFDVLERTGMRRLFAFFLVVALNLMSWPVRTILVWTSGKAKRV
ncbi:FAD/NAD(P)-binding domain-containing protein [Gautieria morchelliformis]|nr:FAD/NAD(P)-binding domain-containing protein [Gautieria morchelliformis]